jgi:hypothetical protein
MAMMSGTIHYVLTDLGDDDDDDWTRIHYLMVVILVYTNELSLFAK